MGLNKTDFERLDERIKKITAQSVEQIQVNSDLPPTIGQLTDSNTTYAIMAAILFIDIRKSTYLTENSQAKSMVKIYRSFMRMAVDCVRKSGGVTRQFLGDRIMGVFIDSTDEKGDISEKAVDKAIDAARSLQTIIDFSLNKHLKNNVNGKVIECGIGIDYGKILVTQVGMYGVEADEDKEDEVDCVWVGNTTNYASKYSDIATGGEIFISESVYKLLSDEYKDVWTKSAKYKGTKLFQGYTTRDYYLSFSEELGNPIKKEDSNVTDMDTSQQLVQGIEAVEKLQNKLIQREKEIALLEEKLRQENQELHTKCNNAIIARDTAINSKNEIQKKLKDRTKEYFEFMGKIIEFAHCKPLYIQHVTEEFWVEIFSKYYEVGKQLGYSEEKITELAHCGLIAVYSYYEKYEKAYDTMIVMAKTNNIWVKLENKVMNWAKENCRLSELYNVIERRLINYQIPNENRKDFEGYLLKIKELRGW